MCLYTFVRCVCVRVCAHIRMYIYACISTMNMHVYTHVCMHFVLFLQLLLTQDMVSVSAQIARGMYHLSKKGGIIHKDLAARNI